MLKLWCFVLPMSLSELATQRVRLTKFGISAPSDAMILLDSVGKSQLDYVTFT